MSQRVGFGPFSLSVPGGWTLSSVILAGPVEENPGQGLPTTPARAPFQRNLITTMEVVGPQETAESYVNRQIEGLRAANVARRETAKPEPVALAGGQRTGLITEQVITGAGGEEVRQMQLVFIKDGIAFTAIASHLDGASFEGCRDEFRQMLLSYQ